MAKNIAIVTGASGGIGRAFTELMCKEEVAEVWVLAASKSFARNFSRALNVELKGTGITATAVCPGWVDTPLAPSDYNGKKMNLIGVVQPKPVAQKALRAAKRGKDIFVYPFSFQALHIATKFLPQRWAMGGWKWSIRKNL